MPAFLAPLLQGLGSEAANYGVGQLRNYLFGPSRNEQIMNYLQQQYQQAPQQSFEGIAGAEQQRFQNQTLPQLQQQLSGFGGQHSSAYFQQPQEAGKDLATRLAGLRSQFEQQREQQRLGRLGGFSNLLGQQQQNERELAELAQKGAIAKSNISTGFQGQQQNEQNQRSNQIGQLYGYSQPQNIYEQYPEKQSFLQGTAQGSANLNRLISQNRAMKDDNEGGIAPNS